MLQHCSATTLNCSLNGSRRKCSASALARFCCDRPSPICQLPWVKATMRAEQFGIRHQRSLGGRGPMKTAPAASETPGADGRLLVSVIRAVAVGARVGRCCAFPLNPNTNY